MEIYGICKDCREGKGSRAERERPLVRT
jgi:hypothetical protein